MSKPDEMLDEKWARADIGIIGTHSTCYRCDGRIFAMERHYVLRMGNHAEVRHHRSGLRIETRTADILLRVHLGCRALPEPQRQIGEAS